MRQNRTTTCSYPSIDHVGGNAAKVTSPVTLRLPRPTGMGTHMTGRETADLRAAPEAAQECRAGIGASLANASPNDLSRQEVWILRDVAASRSQRCASCACTRWMGNAFIVDRLATNLFAFANSSNGL